MEQVEADFFNKIFFSDDAYFHLDNFIYCQNCFWGSENPQATGEKQMQAHVTF